VQNWTLSYISVRVVVGAEQDRPTTGWAFDCPDAARVDLDGAKLTLQEQGSNA
jgi:hypothetical protein